jgi:hypothetical protein
VIDVVFSQKLWQRRFSLIRAEPTTQPSPAFYKKANSLVRHLRISPNATFAAKQQVPTAFRIRHGSQCVAVMIEYLIVDKLALRIVDIQ